MSAEQLAEEIAHQFIERAKWWRKNQNDPHQIGTAMVVALEECGAVIREAIDKLKDDAQPDDDDDPQPRC